MKRKVLTFLVVLGCIWINAAMSNPSLDDLRSRASNDAGSAVELIEALIVNPEENGEELIRLCRFAANKGSARGKYLWGKCYQEGIGVKKNFRQAFALYKQAAMEGEPDALNAVGLCYASGIGTKANEMEAYAAFVESALLNNRDAKYNLGRVYEKGLGVQNNLKTAIYWYEQAASQGQSQAISRLAELTPAETVQPKITSSLPAASDMRTNASNTPAPSIPQIQQPPPPLNSLETPTRNPEEETFQLVLPKWLLWSIGLGVLGSGTAWGGLLLWKKREKNHTSGEHAYHPKNPQKTFSCIQCGQLLLIPNYSSRKMLECPSCHSDYEVWRDKNGILHLQNKDTHSGMKTYISFGEEESMQSPYAVLGIPENCTPAEAKEAFRKRMKEYHPDRVVNLGQELRELAALKAKEINEAYNLVVHQKRS